MNGFISFVLVAFTIFFQPLIYGSHCKLFLLKITPKYHFISKKQLKSQHDSAHIGASKSIMPSKICNFAAFNFL